MALQPPSLLTALTGSTTAGVEAETCRWQLLRSEDEWAEPAIAEPWDSHIQQTNYVHAMRQSRIYLEHLNATQHDATTGPVGRCAAAILRDSKGGLAGVATLDERLCHLSRIPRSSVVLLGSSPILPSTETCYDRLFSFLKEQFSGKDSVILETVARNSFLWKYLQHSSFLRQHYFIDPPNHWARSYTLHPPQYTEYLLQLNAKKRYNLQRQERLLRDKFGGALALERVGGVADIPLLVRGLATMWERRKSPMEDGGPNAAYYTRIAADLAKRGVWRSYSLVGGSEILALMFGCQFGNVYEVYGTWFNRRYAQYSPGTTLWHMFLRDLIANDPPRLICLGRGEPSPKHFQWMDFAESTTVVMHRRTVGNQALRAARGAYRLLTSRSHPMIHPTMRP